MPEMPPEYCGEAEIVDASFARTLERELAEAREKCETLATAAKTVIQGCPTYGPLWFGSQEIKDLKEALAMVERRES